MDIEKRRALVRELLDGYGANAQHAADKIKNAKSPNYDFVYQKLREYTLSKLLLPPDTDGDDIEALVSSSIERIEKIDNTILDELLHKRPCNYMNAVSTKKVMLLYALQKDFGVKISAKHIITKKNLRGLTDLILTALNKNGA